MKLFAVEGFAPSPQEKDGVRRLAEFQSLIHICKTIVIP